MEVCVVEVGKMIRYYRKLRGMTQEKLGEAIFSSDKAVGHYETGVRIPSSDVLQEIVKALGIEMQDLFTGSEEMFAPLQTIENEHNVVVIRESENILAIVQLIRKMKQKQKLVVILNECSRFPEVILTKYEELRHRMYFCYEREGWRNLQEQLDVLYETAFQKNDVARCICNLYPRLSITAGVRYVVVEEGVFQEEDGSSFPSLTILTEAGFYGTFPKDWFELIKKGDTTKPAPLPRVLHYFR